MLRYIFIAVVVYCAFVVILYVKQRSLLYHPSTQSPIPSQWDASAAQVIAVTTEDGLTLRAWYFPPKTPQYSIIVHFHGNAQHIGVHFQGVKQLLSHGYGLLMAEYRGYGGNAGLPSEDGLYRDGRAYMQWLQEQGVLHDNIVFMGESLGTAVAVKMASEYDVAALILLAPFSSVLDVAQSTYFFAPVSLLLKDHYRSDLAIRDNHAPLLVIHGDKDSIIPIKFGRELFDAAQMPKEMIAQEGAGHNDLYRFDTARHIHMFIENQIKNNETPL